MISTFKLLDHIVSFFTHQSILSYYLSAAWRATFWRSFSSLNLVCKHFSSSVKVLAACSAFQRLSFSWSRSSTIVCIRYTCNENWTVNNKHWWRIKRSSNQDKNKLSGAIYILKYPVGFLILSGLGFHFDRGFRRSERGPLRGFCCLHTPSAAGFSLGSKWSLFFQFVILWITMKREETQRSDQI